MGASQIGYCIKGQDRLQQMFFEKYLNHDMLYREPSEPVDEN